jgi:hypothetical protein
MLYFELEEAVALEVLAVMTNVIKYIKNQKLLEVVTSVLCAKITCKLGYAMTGMTVSN